ncbi:MAG TPA: NAD(P)-dependent oxidoreductase [Dehalococcoidia bacterium]|nr:NAD(P)-dependent oxidoreductase [Dehalococcoidia bacterium]
MKVLITGSSGLIGSMLVNALTDQFDIFGLDARESDNAPDVPTTIADGSDYEAMSKAFDGVDAVVHLAANAPVETPWPDVLKNNISATHNVYEAARQHRVKRVIFASSNHAVGNFEMDEPYSRIRVGDYEGLDPGGYAMVDHTAAIRPDSDYGVSKAFGEATGRYYHEHFGLEVACLRIGTVNAQNSPKGSVRTLATWLSHRDLAQLVTQCITQPLGFEIFYGVSDNTWRFWDTDHAKNTIGYAPQDNGEDYRE